MATRIKMLKLLQEAREFTDFPSRRVPTRSAGPLLLSFRNRSSFALQKRFIRLQAHQTLDIPTPVPINFPQQHQEPCQPEG